MGGHLATIRNQSEQEWVFNQFSSYGGAARLLWIGLNDAGILWDFAWSSGEPFTYANWACGEPNNAGGVERYVAMYYPGHGAASQWNDWGTVSADPIGIPFNGVVELIPGPSVQLHPATLSLWPGETARLGATVTGGAALSYQWQKNGANLSDGANISGAHTSSLVISNVALADAAAYSLSIGFPLTTVTSSPVQLTVAAPPLTGSYAAAVLDNQPLAYWRFNDSGDPSTNAWALEYVGGFNGIYQAGASNSFNGIAGPRPGPFAGFELANSAVETGGSGTARTWVRVPTTPVLNTNTVTFIAWIYPAVDSEPEFVGVFMTRAVTQAGVCYLGNNQIGYVWNTNTTWSFQTGLVPPARQWSFVAVVIEPTQATVYLGTNNILSQAINAIPHGNEAWGRIADIGSDPYCNGSRTFQGMVDEVAVFNHALSPAQIQELYHRAFVPPLVTLSIEWSGPNLILTWPEGTLLEADEAIGPWSPLNSASSPYTVSPTGVRKFYRVQVQ